MDEISKYNNSLPDERSAVCTKLSLIIAQNLNFTEAKIWHAHPVWFINGNPIVGYSSMKDAVRLLFWSGQSFDTPGLNAEGSFKAAESRYKHVDQIDSELLVQWLEESEHIQWDYKNIRKRKGKLQRLV